MRRFGVGNMRFKKLEIINLRISNKEKEMIMKRAVQEGINISSYLRKKALS